MGKKLEKFREKQMQRELNKLITLRQANELLIKSDEELKGKYDMLYTMAIVNTLHSEPFKFGKKRIAEVLNLFFGQVEGLILKTIDPEMMMQTCKKLGINISHKNAKFEINIEGVKQNDIDFDTKGNMAI